MKGWREVPMPDEIAALPKDERGFPITFVTLIGPDGRPDFTTIDAAKIIRCIQEYVCGLCGTPLVGEDRLYDEDNDVAFIGGPLSIDHRNFLDPPMHEACASYAMEVCPHIVHDTSRYKKQDLSDGMRTAIDEVSSERPEQFGMIVVPTDAVTLTHTVSGQPVFLVNESVPVQTFWQDEPWLDEDGRELQRYFEKRYYRIAPHDHDGEGCVQSVIITAGRHRKESDPLTAMLCIGCNVMHRLDQITGPDEIVRITTHQSEEDA